MRIKFDQNLPRSLVSVLDQLGHDVDTAQEEGLGGKDDSALWSAAQSTRRFLITQDLDFLDIRRFRSGTHHGILLLRMGIAGRLAIRRRLEEIFRREAVGQWESCFVVATDFKIRVRRP